MSQPRPLPPVGRAYLAFVIAAGASVIAYSIYDLWRFPVGSYWLVLLALTSFSSTFSIKIPNVSATISVSETFVFICALLYGPSPATIVIAIDGMIISIWRRHRRPHQVLFNAAEPALSLFVAAHAFFWLSGLPNADRAQFPIDVGRNLLPLAVFTFTYFLLNSGLNATIVALQGRKPLWPIWRQHFGWVLLNYFGATSVAALLVHNAREFNPTALGIVVPLLVISYLTFKTSMARVEESSRHVQELNKLYLSTIETLAMAVDAKDQITHGHIRRVQALAVGLARSLGVREDEQLKAIEAASLLHDMGKLAIPEHILNKPGKLSLAEFEKIKKHASIGADILSAIDFPGPVVPIVRHHHEQWNGKGYPDGLAGSDIPIGARILAVVDCFDALTSDRPYRRALTPDEALAHLVQERGEAYDPLVVDTFGRVYKDIAPKDLDFGPHKKTLLEIAEVSQDDTLSTELRDWSLSPTAPDPHLLPLYESRQSFSAQTVLADASEEIGQRLLSLTPGRLVALFLHDAHTGEIVLTHASGTGAESLRGARIGLGERLSGWVAANRRTICNSDAALDLAGYDGQELAGFASCLSTPLTAGDELVGVITLYAADRHAFSDTHRRLVEQAARPLSHLVRGALELEKVQHATGAGAPRSCPRPPRPTRSICPKSRVSVRSRPWRCKSCRSAMSQERGTCPSSCWHGLPPLSTATSASLVFCIATASSVSLPCCPMPTPASLKRSPCAHGTRCLAPCIPSMLRWRPICTS